MAPGQPPPGSPRGRSSAPMSPGMMSPRGASSTRGNQGHNPVHPNFPAPMIPHGDPARDNVTPYSMDDVVSNCFLTCVGGDNIPCIPRRLAP